MSPAELERQLTEHPEVRRLEQVPALWPAVFRRNVIFKHGRERVGERGHLVEKRVSQSADPDAPRAILWDDSGFAVSYNGGAPGQTHGERLDVLGFDAEHATFSLGAIDFAPTADTGTRWQITAGDCEKCHGPAHRPIFSMYPDWPAFYGSDNDELNNPAVAVQREELADYTRFRERAASTEPRYAPLFAAAAPSAYPTWPYRPDVETDIHAPSRAFAYRPGLRLGVLLNRLTAWQVATQILRHPSYPKLGRRFLFELLRCHTVPSLVGVGAAVPYRELLSWFGLAVRDVDIRFAYSNPAYDDVADRAKDDMAIGYLQGYWNSYFDGASTFDELLAKRLVDDLAAHSTELGNLVAPNSLLRKYAHLPDRMQLDAEFFRAMDAKGEWIPIPYPSRLNTSQHREGFPKKRQQQHAALCTALMP